MITLCENKSMCLSHLKMESMCFRLVKMESTWISFNVKCNHCSTYKLEKMNVYKVFLKQLLHDSNTVSKVIVVCTVWSWKLIGLMFAIYTATGKNIDKDLLMCSQDLYKWLSITEILSIHYIWHLCETITYMLYSVLFEWWTDANLCQKESITTFVQNVSG